MKVAALEQANAYLRQTLDQVRAHSRVPPERDGMLLDAETILEQGYREGTRAAREPFALNLTHAIRFATLLHRHRAALGLTQEEAVDRRQMMSHSPGREALTNGCSDVALVRCIAALTNLN